MAQTVNTQIEGKFIKGITAKDVRDFGTNDFPGLILAAYAAKDEQAVADIGATLTLLAKMVSEARTHYDAMVDKRDEGSFGADFFPAVTRLRAKSDSVGRPKLNKKDALLDLL
jgi:hypothetical protein